MAAGGNDEVLLAVESVGHRSGLTSGGEFEGPEFGAGVGIEGIDFVVHRGSGKNEAARGGDGTAEGDGSGFLARNKRAERRVPSFLACEQIYRGDGAPRRSVTRDSFGREDRLAKHSEGRACLPPKLGAEAVVFAILTFRRVIFAGNKTDPHSNAVRVHDEQLARGIVSRAAPIDAADVARKNDGASERRRNVDQAGAGGCDFVSAPFLFFRSCAPRVFGFETFGNNRDARWLRGPGTLARNLGFRNRLFFYRNERPPVCATKDEYAAHFCGDGDGGRVVLPGEESGLRGDIVIPEIVMDDLEAPNKFAGGGFERDYGVGPFIVAFAKSSEIIGAGAASGNEDKIAIGVGGNCGPRVAGAGGRRSFGGPRNWIPGPFDFSGTDVHAANDAAADIHFPVVGDGRADDENVLHDSGSGSDLVAASPFGSGHSVSGEVDFAVRTEIGAELAGFAVEGDEAGVERAEENAESAGLAGFCGRIAPSGDAAVGNLGIVFGEINLGIEFPEFFAGCGIEGDNVIVLSREIELAFDQNWSRFESGFADEIGFDVERARAVGPGDFELSDVRAIDLGCWREARAGEVFAVVRPGGILRFLCLGACCKRSAEKQASEWDEL